MKLPTYKVLDAADMIINEGSEGQFDNAGLPSYPTEVEIVKAERLLYDYIQVIRDLKKVKKGKNNAISNDK